MFTGESIAMVLVQKLTLFIAKNSALHNLVFTPCFHENKNLILVIQYCLLWLKRSTKLMWPMVYLSFQSVSAFSWLCCWLICFLLQEIILWLLPRIPCLPQENTFKLHWKHSNFLVLLSSNQLVCVLLKFKTSQGCTNCEAVCHCMAS